MINVLALSLIALGGPGYQDRAVDVGEIKLPDPSAELSRAAFNDADFVELALVRNAIFARHGRAFSTPWVRAFFEKQPWYKADKRYSDERLSATDRKNLSTLRGVETSIPPAQLRVRRNTVFARHGRTFKSADLVKLFKSKSWYKPNPKFKISMLSPRDHLEVELIQGMEAKAAAVQGVSDWSPGRRINQKVLDELAEHDLATLAFRMVKTLQLKGYEQTCEMAFMTDVVDEDACEGAFKAHKRNPKTLPVVDKATWRAVEQRMARYAITLEHPPIEHCWDVCDQGMGDAALRKCEAKCEADNTKIEAGFEKAQKKLLTKVDQGRFTRNPQLMSQFLNAVMSSAA